ncbi:S-DNA-T family DNA segregation ATPase FtsK/SpoIIIE [Clostridium moniliforme]|uniref:S-DNA-T family DNA segregation ATPase FtsK/SpoIIIE n=1 Tax=Clostridium moniliforme TaxID=39489 RepID=A0ABS4EWV8_9CLOT|nr:DNA translocase FtsK [Clostridium moniliforme]MBP1888495.1 S-DNA-T family DNA segregation ATPase FtsK/SpoIIIE [Clostridium moniliforme]
MSRTSKKSRRKNKSKNTDIRGIIYIAVGILLSVAIYTDLIGALSKISQRLSHFLIGIGSYILPIYLLYLGYEYIKSKGKITLSKNFYGITIYSVIAILVFSTIYIQRLNGIDSFSYGIKDILDMNSTLNGGVIGYIISYPLFKFVGAVGSYIIYLALIGIATVLTFDITLYDLGVRVKNKKNEIKKSRKKEKDLEDGYIDDTFIQVVEKDEEKNLDKKEFLNGVNNKIKILDFMKNSSLDDDNDDLYKDESSYLKEKNDIVEPSQKENIQNQNIKSNKEKLDNSVKAVVHNEIENSILEGKEEKTQYVYPDISLLNSNNSTKLNSNDKQELMDSASKLSETLGSFGVDAKVIQVIKGPSVTRFELQPSPGVKVSKIVNLSDDIALGLAASGVRIEAPIPGKAAVGIEVPNKEQTPVFLREVLESQEFLNTNKKLAFALGKDIGGQCVVGDLSKMPHTLIAGATGSGKSVCINTLIISLLYKYSPDEVKLLMVDPKVVELSVYNGIPHLLIPVVTDPKKAAGALNWAVNEMTRRYKLFADSGARNIDSYNALYDKGTIEEKLPYIVIIVDELADLMMVCPNDVEDYIGRLAQMARAAGMHLVIATQRPSVDVVTGVIKANIPSRISFAVSSQIDSRTILDASGAEKLLGKGDMLYYPVGESKPLRVQGCFISEEEVEKVVEFIKNKEDEVIYKEDIIEHINNEAEMSNSNSQGEDVDELLDEAINIVVDYGQASTSFLQRRLRIGFNRASRIMDDLESRGIISPKDGSRPRQVLITRNDLVEEKSKEDNV